MSDPSSLLAPRCAGWDKLGGPIYNCGCDGYGSGPCDAVVQVCECGEDNADRDHHYRLLRKA